MEKELYVILESLAQVQNDINSLLFLFGEVEINFDLSDQHVVKAVLSIVIRNMTSLHSDMEQQLKKMNEVLRQQVSDTISATEEDLIKS